ncbi:myelin-associated glycoprotein-like [Sinocyclocheilus rhinocerous]|uniref:myelin-associated glycoprotein-like n=1 Tax=Sinocyclocheilus rhinocerous TaxID=307959 RepID=UPI0007B8AD2D|nr:PREDICTED: myelin-associated glycoprotein-like [Sinocyclocheilus rhinocerous]
MASITFHNMGNGTSRPLMTQDSRKNIRRNEKLTEDDPKDKVPFADALRKDKHSKTTTSLPVSATVASLKGGKEGGVSGGLSRCAVNDDNIYSQVLNFDAEMVFWSCLLSLFLWLRVSSANAGEWSAKMPESVVGLSGSCVLIPCTFSYPANGKTYTEFTGIWYKGNEESTVYHTDTSKIIDSFKGRTSLIGDLRKNYCSLKISSLSSSDAGPFMFRIEINDLNKYTYKKKEEIVSITVKETPENPTVSVEEEVTSGKPVTATCAVSHSCPSDLPRVSWSHDGSHSSPSQPQNHGQWKLTSYSLTFTPSREDHNKRLSCSAEFKGKTVTGYKTLKVKYPPYNVNVVTKPSVKENDSVELNCSSNSNPPANSYQWFSSNGKRLAENPTYKLERVSRHTEAISCTAINTEGKNSSGPQKINVLYPPYNVNVVTKSSVKENDSVELTCSSNSNPPANSYQWFSSNGKRLAENPTYKLERVSRHTEAISCTAINTEGKNSSGPQKIYILCKASVQQFKLGWLGFPETIQCFANNSLGSSSITLETPQNGIIIYIAVASAVVVVLACILVYVVARRCGKRAAQLHVIKNEQNEMKITQNKSDLENERVYQIDF